MFKLERAPLQLQRPRGALGGGELVSRERIPQGGEADAVWKRLLEDFDLLGRQLRLARETLPPGLARLCT
jgi:hypothetical protein